MCDRSSDPTEHDAARERPSALDVEALRRVCNCAHCANVRSLAARLTEPDAGEGTLADTVPDNRHPKSCSRWFASDATTGEAICDCGLAAEDTVAGLYHHDFGAILRALGVGDFARSESPHMVVHDVVLPAVRRLRAAPTPDTTEATLRRAHAALAERDSKHAPTTAHGDPPCTPETCYIEAALQQPAVQPEGGPE